LYFARTALRQFLYEIHGMRALEAGHNPHYFGNTQSTPMHRGNSVRQRVEIQVAMPTPVPNLANFLERR
jgi:hypothetical protein